jgi:clan AA aspartic protease (TIGR02281 family)
MHTRFSAQLTVAALTLGLGFALGWWARGPEDPPERDDYVEWAPTIAPDSRAPSSLSKPSETNDQPTLPSYPDSVKDTAPSDSLAPNRDFQSLLEAGAYNEAMALYREVERTDPAHGERLRRIALQFLDSYLNQGNGRALISLIDALLSVHYDDIDVLLVLARHQARAEYFYEAAHTFQLIYTYALTQVDQQPQIERAFESLVATVDAQLSGERRWRELSHFYEHLESLGLTEPRYQLRQAQVYLDHGRRDLGYELLERLSTNPAVAAEVAALRKGAATPKREAVAQSEPRTDSFPLTTVGSHFHLPLRLNRSTDVHLLIDTGASVTTLSQEAFDRLRQQTRFTEVGPQIFNTAGGTAKGTVYRVDQLRLGSHVIPDAHIAVLDFSMPQGVDGLLGMNVLRHFRFEVDQDRAQLHIQPR